MAVKYNSSTLAEKILEKMDESADASGKSKSESSNNDVSWKEWRKRRKEEKMRWKEVRQSKKLKKMLAAEETQVNDTSDVNTTDCGSTSSKGRKYTVSIAVPGSIVDNAQSAELKTYLVGQVARAATVYNVDEIVVFDEYALSKPNDDLDDTALKIGKKHQGCRQMVRILQYLECPQYLRKYLFPLHSDLEYAGLLNPLDAPHHLRATDESKYREGIVVNKPVKEGKGSFVNIGLNKNAVIDKPLTPNIRVTVKLDDDQPSKKHFRGVAVSPSAPCKKDGIYWGYSVRFAKSFGTIISECPYKEGYDIVIGTSDKGAEVDSVSLNPFKHLLIVFGGLQGIEACIEADEALEISEPSSIFHHYLNTCPNQGSRTIRTEEAILITLAALRPRIKQSQQHGNSSVRSR